MAPSSSPRLLVALRRRPDIDRALERFLPAVPYAYAGDEPPADLAEVEALLVGSVARELGDFSAARTPRLAFVQRIYTGVDGFPFDRFPEPIRLAGNVGAFAPFVAEHAVALVLAAARQITAAGDRVRRGELRPAPEHRVLSGGTAVILGYGEIGREVARRLAAFDLRIVGVNRTGRMAPGVQGMYPADRLFEALAEGSVVVDARPLTRATERSIDARALGAMRPEAVLANVGRAATVDEEALYRHLVAHPEFRAAFDVWWEEDYGGGRLGDRFGLARLPNFVGTPHCAGVGPGVEARVLDRALENLARYFRGEPPRHVVDRREYRA